MEEYLKNENCGRDAVAVRLYPEENTAVFSLHGDIDHHGAKAAREEIDSVICKLHPRLVKLEVSAVNFMDSAGLGLILGRYAKVSEYGGTLTLCNPSERIMKLVTLAGVDKLIETETLPEHCTGAEKKEDAI